MALFWLSGEALAAIEHHPPKKQSVLGVSMIAR